MPATNYAQSGDINIAYQVIGQDPRDLVYVPGWVSNIEVMWEDRTGPFPQPPRLVFAAHRLRQTRNRAIRPGGKIDALPSLELDVVLTAVGQKTGEHTLGGQVS